MWPLPNLTLDENIPQPLRLNRCQIGVSCCACFSYKIHSLQIAQQEAQRAAFFVEKAKQERQQKIVQAEGEAKAASMVNI